MKRLERLPGETVEDMLQAASIIDDTIYLFHGHPPLVGRKLTSNWQDEYLQILSGLSEDELSRVAKLLK